MYVELFCCFALLTYVYGFYFIDFEVAQFKKYKEICYNDSNMNDEAMVNFLLDGKMTDDVACLMRCIYVNSGLMAEDGHLIEDKLQEAYPESWNFDSDDVKEMIDVCKNATISDDPCQAAVKIHYCYFDIDDDDSSEESASGSGPNSGSYEMKRRRDAGDDHSRDNDGNRRRRRSLREEIEGEDDSSSSSSSSSSEEEEIGRKKRSLVEIDDSHIFRLLKGQLQ